MGLTRVEAVVPQSIISGVVAFAFATPSTPICARKQPPRDKMWRIQKIRLSLQGGGYILYTGLHGIPQNSTNMMNTPDPTKQGLTGAPLAGVWINNISGEYEVLWVPCVPPGNSNYSPQIPDVIHQSDTLIMGVADAGIVGAVAQWSIKFTVEVDEVPDTYE